MNRFADYTDYDGVGLAELVRTGEITPLELVEAAIARIEEVDPQLNAVVHRMYEYARAQAQAPLPEPARAGGVLAGVPCLLKDFMAHVAGEPTTAGSRALDGYVPEHNSSLVARLQAAGLIILGKTNTAEMGLAPVTEPQMFGPCKNPWDLKRSPAGSSGGSAAVVAARAVPIASGGDGGGSIRMPASACGIFGLKPSRGRNPIGPDRAEYWRGYVVEHVLTRSVRDSAAALDATAGPDQGAPYWLPSPGEPFLDHVSRDPGSLRIGFTTQSLIGRTVHADCVGAVERTAALLTELGHQVEEAVPEIDRASFVRAYLGVICVDVATDLDEINRLLGRGAADDVEPATRMLGLIGRNTSAVEAESQVRTLHRINHQVRGFFDHYDVLLSPTMARPPLRTGALEPNLLERTALRAIRSLRAVSTLKRTGLFDQVAAKMFDAMGFTPVFNVTGQPAMSMPLAWNDAGLPIGMHFAGRYGDEETLFRLAGQLETARPWLDRRPAVCAG